jgi:SpoVK/Ycf46/Vps4 family AAA+-type ATPase
MFFEGGTRYRKRGIPYRRGLLFTGPPGKTLTLKTLADHTAAKFITVLGKSGVDDSDIQRALDLAGKCSPAVVLFEDLDKLIEAKDISLSHFLNLLDGLKVLSGVLVIATCNEPERLDPALLHRGRAGSIEFGTFLSPQSSSAWRCSANMAVPTSLNRSCAMWRNDRTGFR